MKAKLTAALSRSPSSPGIVAAETSLFLRFAVSDTSLNNATCTVEKSGGNCGYEKDCMEVDEEEEEIQTRTRLDEICGHPSP